MLAHRVCLRKLCSKFCHILYRNADGLNEDYDRLLPERMVNVEECAALLADPMRVNISDEEVHCKLLNRVSNYIIYDS